MKEGRGQKWILKFTLLFLVLAIGVGGTFARAEAAEASDKTVRIGCFPLRGFYNINDGDGTVAGYGADYTEEIFDHAELDYEYVKYSSWVDALDGLSKNEIDVLAPAQHTPERDASYLFDSFPIGTEYGSLLTLSTNDTLTYEGYDSFEDLNVGCVKSVVFLDDFESYEERNHFQVHYTYYKDTPALVAALNEGEVDAILVNMMVKTDSMKLLARFGAAPFYYMLNPGAGDLKEKLDLVIDKVTSNHPELQNELGEKYFSDFDKIPFSKEELNYIANCGTLKVACGSKYPPFSYVDESTGEITGVGRAIMEQISEISGLQFSCAAIPLSGDLSAFLQKEGIALLAGVENDASTQLHGTTFSESYMKISKYFIGLNDSSVDTDMKQIVAVASSADSQIEAWKEIYPNFEFHRYPSIDGCIDALRKGKVDFFLDDRYSMESVLASPRNADLRLFPAEAVNSNICFKILLPKKEAKLLTSILNKAIREIPEKDIEQYLNDFTQENRYQYTISDFLYQYRMQMVFLILLILLLFFALAMVSYTRKKASLDIRENEMKLRNITNNINGGVIVLIENEGLHITFANDGFLDLIGCTREEFEKDGRGSYLAYVHPDDFGKMKDAIDSEKVEFSLELRVLRSDGKYIPALFNCTTAKKSSGEKEHYCVILDMTEQNALLEELRVEKRRTDLILDRVNEIFYEINMRNHTISTSKSFLERLGWTLPEKIPVNQDGNYGKMWHTDEVNLEKLRRSTEEMNEKKEPVSTIVLMESKRENRLVWCEVFQHPILGEDGAILTIIGLIRDVDEQISERERLLEQAQRDPLTGLYNKETFEKIVSDLLEKTPEQNHALLFIDLDHFKSLNDTLGHLVGDRAICEAADKLRIIFANFDILSRFGGDEFCIFVKNIPLDTLLGKMDWLVEKLHETYSGEKGTVHITCSCGIVCTKEVGVAYKTLMKHADEALYYSKEHGRDRYTLYDNLKK